MKYERLNKLRGFQTPVTVICIDPVYSKKTYVYISTTELIPVNGAE